MKAKIEWIKKPVLDTFCCIYRINFENEKPDQINDWELISVIKENDELLYDSSIRKNYRLIWKNLSFIKNKNKT